MFKQLVTNTTATLIPLAAAPATVSKKLGTKASRRAISFSLHTVAVFAMALAFQALTSVPAGASILAACLTPGGAVTNVGFDDPLRPCGPKDEVIRWEEVAAPEGVACPAYNAGMIDAALLEAGLDTSAGDPNVFFVTDDPGIINCFFETASGGLFFVEAKPSNAALFGAPDQINNDEFTTVQSLTDAQVLGCAAQIRLTLVWDRYCAPFLPD